MIVTFEIKFACRFITIFSRSFGNKYYEIVRNRRFCSIGNGLVLMVVGLKISGERNYLQLTFPAKTHGLWHFCRGKTHLLFIGREIPKARRGMKPTTRTRTRAQNPLPDFFEVAVAVQTTISSSLFEL